MTYLDWAMIALYFVFIIKVTQAFRHQATSAEGFIKGGSAMTWWMAGATAFMTQFSAWTFTGAAAKAYADGLSIMFVFWGNALGFFISALYFAKRYRRLRVATAMDVIKLRFDKSSEQTFTWLSFPITLIGAGIWLNGLGAFLSATFGISIDVTIVGISLLVTFIAVSGGVWTVSATNVIQLVLLIAITLVVGFTAAKEVLVLPVDSLSHTIMGEDIAIWQIFVLWIGAVLFSQTLNTNNALSSYRFLITRNEKEATRAATLAGVLFLFAPLLWFSPPWFVASLDINLVDSYPNLGASADNAAYLYYIDHYMPNGLLGLVMVAMLAATVSPMTTALNRNAGIVVNNIYLSLVNPQGTDRQQMLIGKMATLLTGVMACAVALFFARLEGYSLFDIMMLFTAMIQMPLSIPSFLALLNLRTPGWSGWATILVGLAVSLFMHFGFKVEWVAALFDYTLTAREHVDFKIAATFIAHLIFTGGFFMLTPWLSRAERNTQDIRQLLAMPMSQEEQSPIDHTNGIFMGRALALLGILVSLIAISADTWRDAAIFLGIGGFILLCGSGLAYKSSRLHRQAMAL
ncbi:transporter (plasmid) [Photobacterium sp. DA100]|uniref:sodium:solute symporter family transporter n=1 Tax=Photobacterium sp. DA100 TaxID=3027472 RepID=UPI002478F4C8|nr:transporter [Photobacterium sp. DA100]WEM44567.1 transporter [Photobacterium sp. DA100]